MELRLADVAYTFAECLPLSFPLTCSASVSSSITFDYFACHLRVVAVSLQLRAQQFQVTCTALCTACSSKQFSLWWWFVCLRSKAVSLLTVCYIQIISILRYFLSILFYFLYIILLASIACCVIVIVSLSLTHLRALQFILTNTTLPSDQNR